MDAEAPPSPLPLERAKRTRKKAGPLGRGARGDHDYHEKRAQDLLRAESAEDAGASAAAAGASRVPGPQAHLATTTSTSMHHAVILPPSLCACQHSFDFLTGRFSATPSKRSNSVLEEM